MLKGKCVLITGSTTGLGYAAAVRFAGEGCNLVLNGLDSADAMGPKLRAIRETHDVDVLFHGADLARPREIAALVKAAEERFGGVDILVNNAVVRHAMAVERFSEEEWDEALAINLSAAFHTIRLCLPHMRARNWGRIINMSSVYGMFAAPNRVAYVTAKTGLIGMTKAVALETVDSDITCNALCPGTVLTDPHEAKLQAMMAETGASREDATRTYLAGKQPGNRFISADSVAGMMVFLCSPAGRDITATAIPIDHGWSAS